MNVNLWEGIYSQGNNYLRYPDDAFLKVYFSYCKAQHKQDVLDFGAGSGVLSEFFIDQGARVVSYDPSVSARSVMEARLGNKANIIDESALSTFSENSFDLIVAWHVIYYLDREVLNQWVERFKRLLRPGGKFIATALADDDIYIKTGEELDGGYYRLTIPGQVGAKVALYAREEYDNILRFPKVDIGNFGFQLGDRKNHYHLILASS